MKRRDFLKIAASIPLLGFKTQEKTAFGWIPGHYSKRSSFRTVAAHLTNFGKNRLACLWKPWEAVTGREWLAHTQRGPDCVAQATGGSMDLLTAIQIAWRKKKEKWITKSSIDAIYSGGRLLIGHDSRAGMPGVWAIKYLKEYGNLLRQPYPPYDLTPYDYNKWANKKLPDLLLKIAKEHPLLESNPVLSWEEFRDSIAAGYPVVFCASMGAENSKRDEDGFIKPRGTWYHAWLGAGVIDGKRPGACLLNSHSPYWGSGPKKYGQPDGSVWIDADHIDYHCRNFRDSHALCLHKGYPKPEEDYILW